MRRSLLCACLLSSLLPTSVIRKLKKGDAVVRHFHKICRDFLLTGQMPKPQVFESVSIFFCDIVSFTSICSDSTAHQIIEFLNDLYGDVLGKMDDFAFLITAACQAERNTESI